MRKAKFGSMLFGALLTFACPLAAAPSFIAPDPTSLLHQRGICAPTGTSTFGPLSGLIDDGTDRTVSARSTRCLYGGYRSDSPVAGLFDVYGWFDANTAYANWLANPIGNQPPKPAKEPFILARQEGWNFAGLQYTLHRHYDPVLMQFTSPDPIASPFYNLYGYCGNNPSGAFDPDGLHPNAEALVRKQADAWIEGAAFKIGDIFSKVVTLGQGGFDNSDREAMQWKHQQDGTAGAFNNGQIVGGGIYVAAASLATGGYAASLMGTAFVGTGATTGFVGFSQVTTFSMTASVTSQVMTTGTANASQTAGDTLLGIGTFGVFAGAGRIASSVNASAANFRAANGYGWLQGGGRLNPLNYSYSPAVSMNGLGGSWRFAGPTSGRGYSSFRAFKNAEGAAGKNMHWHHIVEQTPGNVSRFGALQIHHTRNLLRIEDATHRQASAYYSSIDDVVSPVMTVRQALAARSFGAQKRFGLKVLRRFGVRP